MNHISYTLIIKFESKIIDIIRKTTTTTTIIIIIIINIMHSHIKNIIRTINTQTRDFDVSIVLLIFDVSPKCRIHRE